jgi:hypothetical protein
MVVKPEIEFDFLLWSLNFSINFKSFAGPGWLNELGSWITTRTSLSPIRLGFMPGFVNYKKGCARLASDKVYQLLAHDRWFSGFLHH